MFRKIKIGIMIFGVLILIFLFSHNSYFFDFDKVLHFSSTEELDYFEKNEAIFSSKEKLYHILFNYESETKTLVFDDFVKDLLDNNFVSRELPFSCLDEIANIFKEQSCSLNRSSSCISVFRDVLVFIKDDEVVGFAKICFECGDSNIVGTTSNTSNFGECGKYEDLYKILNN